MLKVNYSDNLGEELRGGVELSLEQWQGVGGKIIFTSLNMSR